MAATQQDPILSVIPSARPSNLVSNLLRGPHGQGSPLFWASAIDTNDFDRYFTDFTNAAIAGGDIGASFFWQETDSGAGPTPFAKLTPTNLLTSHVASAIDGVDAHATELVGQKMMTGFNNAEFWVKGEVDVVTNLHLEVGFSGGVAAAAAKNVTAVTPTFANTNEFAGVVIDTGFATIAGLYVQGQGGAPAGTFTSISATNPLANATEFIIGVVLRGLDVYVIANWQVGTTSPNVSNRTGLVAQKLGGLTGSQVMTPFVNFVTIGANAKAPKLDFLDTFQQKPGAPF